MSDGKQQLATLKAPPMRSVFASMFVCIAIVGIAALLLSTKNTALAVILGALVATFGHAYFAWQAFRYQGAKYAHKIVNAFVHGEQGKFAIVVVGFAAIMLFNPRIEVVPLFISFVGFYFFYSFLLVVFLER